MNPINPVNKGPSASRGVSTSEACCRNWHFRALGGGGGVGGGCGLPYGRLGLRSKGLLGGSWVHG